MKIPVKQICPKCNGTGFIGIYRYMGAEGSTVDIRSVFGVIHYYIPCSNCKRTGFINTDHYIELREKSKERK